jgi:hypothetical protein
MVDRRKQEVLGARDARLRYARPRATNPTYGSVTLIVMDEPRKKEFYVMCLATGVSRLRLIRAQRLYINDIARQSFWAAGN